MAPPPGRMPTEISRDPQGPLEISANILSKGSPGKDPCHKWRLLFRSLIHITPKTKLDLGDDAFRARDVKATIYLMASTHIEIVHELQLLQKKNAYAPVGLAKAVSSVEHT